MSYYRGDYYRGDYYRGDPGFFGDIANIGKKLIGAAVSISPVGRAIKTGVSLVTGGGTRPLPLSTFAPESFGTIPAPSEFPGSVPTPGAAGAIQRFLPGGLSGYQAAPAGYHVNKAYARYLRSKALGHDVKMPHIVNVIVKNRHVNPLNPSALRRANGRQHGAVRMMRSVLRGSGYTIGRSGIGKARRRARR